MNEPPCQECEILREQLNEQARILGNQVAALRAQLDILALECEALRQVASGNDERLDLLVKKHSGKRLTKVERVRLAALQELISAVIPRVTPDMLRALLPDKSAPLTPEIVRECIARSGKDSAEMDAHLRQTFTAPDNNTTYDSCGYPHKEPAQGESLECDECGAVINPSIPSRALGYLCGSPGCLGHYVRKP